VGDDYYVQLVSEFDFKGDSALKVVAAMSVHSTRTAICRGAGVQHSYDPLKFKREASGFLYQATTGKCNFKLETKKVYLTPWLRLDSAKDTLVDYNFLTSNSHEANLSQLVGDVNAASGLLALTGVGTGVAIMGKLAGSWVENNPQVMTKTPPSAKYSSETHSLPAQVVLGGDSGSFSQNRLGVYEVVEGGIKIVGVRDQIVGRTACLSGNNTLLVA